MTLKEIGYLLMVAQCASISEAAKQLYVAQPSLTHAIQSVEKEVGFRIFDRGRSGVTVTEQGEELLSDIRTIYEQMAAVQSKYIEKRPERKTFSVSIQHFSPAGEVAMRLLSRLEEESYIVKFLEGKTTEVIADVASGRSEIGFLHFPDEKEPGILLDLRNEKMEFYSIGTAKPCLLLRKDHPLAALPMVSLQELSPYPLVSYDYGVDGSVYVSEEGVTMLQTDRQVAVSDGLMLTNVLISTDTCAVAMPYLGALLENCGIVFRPILGVKPLHLGWIKKTDRVLQPLAKQYLQMLRTSRD